MSVPQAPPTNVTCSTQQHSITVSWDPPNFETVNGILTEYLVNYYIANDFGGEAYHPPHALDPTERRWNL